ncbi:MAG TPA: hypothetical protein GX708_16705 [Gallicola sp.]|nr:hypothetical protein [Gallicola sp.]
MEEKKEAKKEIKTTLQKTKTVQVATKKGGTYAYKYTELADINEYIESIGETYYQFIERIGDDDYIMTVRQKGDKDSQPIRGCRVVQANLESYSNPAQEQGSALTYARRYSLLMAYGLATEDDDAQSLSREKEDTKMETKEEAENYIITFGKHKGKTLKEIDETDPSYLDWLLDYEKADDTIKQAIKLLTTNDKKVSPNDFEQVKMIDELQEQLIETYIHEGLTALDGILTQFKINSLNELKFEEAEQVIKVCQKRKEQIKKEKKEVF